MSVGPHVTHTLHTHTHTHAGSIATRDKALTSYALTQRLRAAPRRLQIIPHTTHGDIFRSLNPCCARALLSIVYAYACVCVSKSLVWCPGFGRPELQCKPRPAVPTPSCMCSYKVESRSMTHAYRSCGSQHAEEDTCVCMCVCVCVCVYSGILRRTHTSGHPHYTSHTHLRR